jgi:hypothetical protein
VSPGDGQTLFTLGFSGMLPMKAWLTTGAFAFVIMQVVSALSMYGRLGSRTPTWIPALHRWSGTAAFVLTLPAAFHCVWSLGFVADGTRALVHSICGCAFYGVFAAKMLALRLPGLRAWTLPVLGGLLAATLTVIWFGAALWYFTRPGVPLS